MKTLLATLTTLSVSTPTALAPIATQSLNNEATTNPLIHIAQWHKPTSLENLQLSVDEDFKEWRAKEGVHRFKYTETIEKGVQDKYKEFFGSKVLALSELSTTPAGEVIEEEFKDVYKNNTPNPQTFQTQSYSKEISATSEFSIQISESVSVSVDTAFIFAGATITASISSSQTWTSSTTTTETVTVPSQSFTVEPFSQGIATYSISSNLYHNRGMLRSEISLNNSDNQFYTRRHFRGGSTKITRYPYTYQQVIDGLKESGYGDLIKLDSPEFSIFSVDDVEYPTKAYFNIPITWTTKTGKMSVRFSQEPLK